MRVLVTGATGFVGRAALRPLRDAGFDVIAVSRNPPTGHDGQWRSADLHDLPSVRRVLSECRPTHLLHLAWNATPGQFWTSPDNIVWMQSSMDLLEAFVAAGGRRAVFASTCAVYAPDDRPCSEDTTLLRPSTLYGASKLAYELIGKQFCRLNGVSFASGRLFQPFGPAEHSSRVIPAVITSLLRGEAARCTAGDQVRDFVHVADCGRAFAALLAADAEGSFNIGSGLPTPLGDVLKRIASRLGREELLLLGALPHRAGEPPVIVADTARLRSLGWSESLTLDEGLNDTIEWWRAELSERV